MNDSISPKDRDYTIEEINAWPSDEPLPLLSDWDRGNYYTGAGFQANKPPKYLVESADRYYANFQIIDDPSGPQIQDSLGQIHALPTGIASITPVDWSTPISGSVYVKSFGNKKYLILRDAAGTAALAIPNYGWDVAREVGPFVQRFGWTLDAEIRVEIKPEERDTIIPGWSTAPVADVGEGLRGPQDDPYLGNKLAADRRVPTEPPKPKGRRWWQR